MRTILFFFAFILLFDCCTNSDTTAKDTIQQDTIRNQNEQLLTIENDSLPIKRMRTTQDSLLEAREDSLQKILQARMIGYENNGDTTSRLKFKEISSAQFSAFKENYYNPIDTSIQRVPHSKVGFSIKTADSLYYFKYDLDDFHEYTCFVKPLKLYMIYSGSGHNEIAWMVAIDSLNNKSYYIQPTFDDGFMETRVSPRVKYILWFQNNSYDGDKHSFISIVKINREEIFYTYTDLLGYTLGEWFIKELAWITDTSFALKVYKEKGENNKLIGVRYLKASF